MSTATELMSRALEAWENGRMLRDMDDVMVEIRTFLAAEPEAGPIGLLHPNGRFELIRDELPLHLAFPVKLYTRPEPASKPMTEDEIDEELETNEYYCAKSFADGVRFAEKHHFGMGVNPSGPDSIDLQSRCRGDKL